MKKESIPKTLIIGCGIRQVKQIKEISVAIDISQDYLNKAKKLKPKNIYIKASVEKLPFQNNSFKKIIFTHVLEHLNNPTKAVSEIYRVLVPKGILFLKVPSKKSEDFLLQHNPIFKNFVKKFHKTQFDKTKLQKYLKKFRKLRIEDINNSDVVFWWLWGKFITYFNLEHKFYIEECGQIHSKKLDLLTKQFSRLIFIISLILYKFIFINIHSEYKVIVIK